MPKRDWSAYDKKAKAKGQFIVTFILEKKHSPLAPIGRGRPQEYADSLVAGLLVLAYSLKLPLRKVIGFAAGLIQLAKVSLPLPHYSLLSKRQLDVPQPCLTGNRLLIDATGLSLTQSNTWNEAKHGGVRCRREFVKLSIVVNADDLAIVNYKIMPAQMHDIVHLKEFIQQEILAGKTIIGDGAYDSFKSHESQVKVLAPPKPNSRIRWKVGYQHPRNLLVAAVQTLGLPTWKRQAGYHLRSLVETVNFCFKKLFSEKLSSRTPRTIVREIGLKIAAYNQLLTV